MTLQEIETNKIQQSQVELLRPLSIKEFKLLLSKKWDLDSHLSKTAHSMATRSSFDSSLAPRPKEEILQAETEKPAEEENLDLEQLFYQAPEAVPEPQLEPQLQPADILADTLPFVEPVTIGPEIDAISKRTRSHDKIKVSNLTSEECNAGSTNFNSYRVHEQVSKNYLHSKEEIYKKSKIFLQNKVNPIL